MADCKKCRFRSICKKRPKMEGATIAECDLFRNDIERTEPMTNADRIRAMSDEELYLWAKKQIGCGFDFFPCGVVCEGKCESYSDEQCKAKIMEWLKQPAEGDA